MLKLTPTLKDYIWGGQKLASVVTMEEGKERTFRVAADGKYDPWEKEPGERTDIPYNIHIVPNRFNDSYVGGEDQKYTSEIHTEADGSSYIRIQGVEGISDAYKTIYQVSDDIASGQYIVVRYRYNQPAESEAGKNPKFQFYTSTVDAGAKGEYQMIETSNKDRVDLIRDGEWHTVVIDLSKSTKAEFVAQYQPDVEGRYIPKFLRFDFFNFQMDPASYLDVAYVAFRDDLDEIKAKNTDVDITVIEGSTATVIEASN